MSRLRWFSLALASLLGACAGPEVPDLTQVVVVVYADAQLQAMLSRIEVEVRDETGAELASEHQFEVGAAGTTFPLSFGVHQAAGGADWFLLIARGVGQDSTTLVQYKVIAQFVKGKTGLLPVVLSISCLGVLCEGTASESCYANVGMCVPVSRTTPETVAADGGAGPWTLVDAGEREPADASAREPADAGSSIALPVAPSSHGFSSAGGRRGDGTMSVYGDGFEVGERRCTLDSNYCVTGSLVP